MNISCPNGCGCYLRHDEVDSRGEWVEIEMSCPHCEETFCYREDYAIQSKRVVSQTLTDSEGKEREL